MAPKKQKPIEQKPVAFNPSAGQGLQLGPVIKALGLNPTLTLSNGKTVDYSTKTLEYTDSSGVSTPATKATIGFAINQLAFAYPALGEWMKAQFDITSGDSKESTAAWDSLASAKFNITKATPPALKSAAATIKNLENQIQMGVASTTATQEANAFDSINSTIDSWNYSQSQKDFLSAQMAKLVLQNGNHITNQKSLMGILRGQDPSGLGTQVDAQIKQDYNNAFPGLEKYNNSPSAVRLSESQYMAYAQKVMDVATQYGAPMPNNSQIGELLNHNVSPLEYQQRVTDIYAAVSNADPNVKRLLQEEYGIGPGKLMHYFMDPKNALQTMQRQVAGAEIQDYAQRVGLKNLGEGEAQQLAQMAKLSGTVGNQGLAYGVNQIEGSLANAARDVTLTKSLPGSNAPTVNTQALIASQLAGFGGINQVAAQTEVARAESAKVAPFEKGGGYAENAKGIVGLGSART